MLMLLSAVVGSMSFGGGKSAFEAAKEVEVERGVVDWNVARESKKTASVDKQEWDKATQLGILATVAVVAVAAAFPED